jgi:hypothetical protein
MSFAKQQRSESEKRNKYFYTFVLISPNVSQMLVNLGTILLRNEDTNP